MTRIFISYRRDDSKMAAGRIYDHLVGKFGDSNVFIDIASIEGGDDFVNAIEQAVSACDVLIAVIGPDWLTIVDKTGRRRLENPNDFVRVEISTALKRGIRLIPVLLDGTEMMSPDDLPENMRGLTRKNAVPIDTERFRSDIQRVIAAIEKTLSAPPPSNAQILDEFFAQHPVTPEDPAEVGKRVGELLKAEGVTVEPPKLKYDIGIRGMVGGFDSVVVSGTALPVVKNYRLSNVLLPGVSIRRGERELKFTRLGSLPTALVLVLSLEVSADQVLTVSVIEPQHKHLFTIDLKTLE